MLLGETMSNMDEFKYFSIHKNEFEKLPVKIQKAFQLHENIEFYPAEKNINKVEEFKKVVMEYTKHIKKSKGKESNIECLMIDQMIELLQKMMAAEVRQLNLKNILKK